MIPFSICAYALETVIKYAMVLEYKALKGKKNFEHLFAKGSFYRSAHLSLRVSLPVVADQVPSNRWAICVSSKLGKAVRRNRYRRICRETLRQLSLDMLLGYDIAIFPRDGFTRLRPVSRKQCIIQLLKKAGLIRPSHANSAKGDYEHYKTA